MLRSGRSETELVLRYLPKRQPVVDIPDVPVVKLPESAEGETRGVIADASSAARRKDSSSTKEKAF